MDVVRAFNNNALAIEITIKGTCEHPLFRASDIGEVLGISNIRSSISDFRETERVSVPHPTPNGIHEVTFLTTKGLYKLLFKSRKQVAIDFQDWVFEVIEEIRLTGEFKREKEKQIAEEQARVAKDKITQLEQQNALLEKQNDELITVSKNDDKPAMYIFDTDSRGTGLKKLKIGWSAKVTDRIKPYFTLDPYGQVPLVVSFPKDFNPQKSKAKKKIHIVEDFVFLLLSQYRINNSEVFENIDMDYAQHVLSHVSNLVNLSMMPNETDRYVLQAKLLDFSNLLLQKDVPVVSKCVQKIQVTPNDFIDPDIEPRQDEYKFDEFIKQCAIIKEGAEASTKVIAGQYRIWRQSNDKDAYHALLDYLKRRFKPIRLASQDQEDGVVNGYQGLSINPHEFKMPVEPSELDFFAFQNCVFDPSGKALLSEVVGEFVRWKKSTKRVLYENDAKYVKQYFKELPNTLWSNVWSMNGNGQGFYGFYLKSHGNLIKKHSSTCKKVERRSHDNVMLAAWPTIAKAAEAEGISPAKLSRLLKDKKAKFDNYYYISV